MSQVKNNLAAATVLVVDIVLLPLYLVGAGLIVIANAVRRRFIAWLGGPHGHF